MGKKKTFSPFLNSTALRWVFKCSGVKTCEHIQDRLRNFTHSQVDEGLYETLGQIKTSIGQIEQNEERRKARSCFDGLRRRFRDGICTDREGSCSPELFQAESMVCAVEPFLERFLTDSSK